VAGDFGRLDQRLSCLAEPTKWRPFDADDRINCAVQLWPNSSAPWCGVHRPAPATAAEHFLPVVTDEVSGHQGTRDLPVLPDPDGPFIYVQEDVGRAAGGRPFSEPPTPSPGGAGRSAPIRSSFQPFVAPRLGPFSRSVMDSSRSERIPPLASTGMKKLYNGAATSPPQIQFIPRRRHRKLRDFFVAADSNSVGSPVGGGARQGRWPRTGSRRPTPDEPFGRRPPDAFRPHSTANQRLALRDRLVRCSGCI